MHTQIVKEAARQAVNSSMPLRVLEAVVVSPPPALSIQLAGDRRMIIPAELLLVAQHLTPHSRMLDRELDNSDILNFEDELKAGDQVLTLAVQGGQSYYIADRVVRYGANS